MFCFCHIHAYGGALCLAGVMMHLAMQVSQGALCDVSHTVRFREHFGAYNGLDV